MREQTSPERQLREIKYQLAQLAYDQFGISLQRIGFEHTKNFSELSFEYRTAWIEAIWSAVEASKTKVVCDKRSTKEQDNGYMVYANVRLLMKEHIGVYTYSKLPENVKEMYRDLALKIYQTLDAEEEG